MEGHPNTLQARLCQRVRAHRFCFSGNQGTLGCMAKKAQKDMSRADHSTPGLPMLYGLARRGTPALGKKMLCQ